MCFDGNEFDEYETRVEIRNGERHLVNTYYPRHGMSRRRRYGFGGSYYPSRYYARPPTGCYTNRQYAYLDRYPNVPLPQDFVRDVYPRQYSVHGHRMGYRVGARAALPRRYSTRSYYNVVPSYGSTAHVYPPGHATTTTTTYHVTNAQAPLYASPTAQLLRETRPAYAHGHAYTPQAPTREDIQFENRRIATQRGAYDARKIRPADARDDDPFWCREVNGEWHLRSYYQIENECHPGRWMMDAEIGFLVFHRT